jgi:hypothetical protein
MGETLVLGGKVSERESSSNTKPPIDLPALMKMLVLKDEELDDVIHLREEFMSLREDARFGNQHGLEISSKEVENPPNGGKSFCPTSRMLR